MKRTKKMGLVLGVTAGIMLMLGTAAAGWRDYWLQPVKRGGQQEKGLAALPDLPRVAGEFALVSLTEQELDGSPALALTFTEPLDPKTSYDALVRVIRPEGTQESPKKDENSEDEEDGENGDSENRQGEITETDGPLPAGAPVQGKWIVGDNPRMLFFPHITPQTRYSVQVQAALTDKAGHQLGKDRLFSVLSSPVSPAYYFASRGMVLPARQNGGLPVVTVNVPEVDVQFFRVRDDQIFVFLDKVLAGKTGGSELKLRGAVDHWDLDRLHSMADSVYINRFVTESKANRRAVTFLPVEEIKELSAPGVYVAVMSRPGRFGYEYQTTYFYVSDLGLHARVFEKSADVYVNSLTSGKAVPGVSVRWLDAKGAQLAKAEVDATGRAHFASLPLEAKVIQAQKGNQVAMIALKEPALDLSEYAIKGNPGKPVRLFAWSGRDLYRPGETFELSVLARDADGRALAPLPVQAILKRPDGKKQFTAFWKPGQLPGYYRERVELPLDAPTGFWQLELRADPADTLAATVFRFGVEEFLPERMKLTLNAPESGLKAEKNLEIQVTGQYLYGAPAEGNRLLGVVQFSRKANPLEQDFPGFVFGDANEDSLRVRHELSEQQLDESGKARVQVSLDSAKDRHSAIAVQSTFSLLESGGRPVVRSLERVIWPAETLIGVRPLFAGDYAKEGAPAQFEVLRTNQQAELLAASGLPVRLFQENRHYYWRYDDERGWNSGFTESEELVSTTQVSLNAGQRGTVTVPVAYGRYRLEISDPESGQTLKYRFYAGWSAKGEEEQGQRPDKVTLKLDKPAYREGQDTAQLTITPPHAGEALVTVEGGGSTLWLKRLAMPEKGMTLPIPVDASWTSHDLYVTVMVLRPGSEGDRVTPARALGIVPLPLEREKRRLAVNVEAPEKMKPEQDMSVQVQVPGAAGKEALLTLSAVDVGILNITNFATPDPFAFFFGQLRYGPDLHDVYGRLIEKMAGQKGRLRFGGDAAPKTTSGLPKKVRLVDLFSGPVKLDAEGKAQVTLPVPDFNGTLRLMAVVATADSYGSGDREVIVAAPLIAELSTPRFMNMGDESSVALDLHNLSGGPAMIQVRIPPTAGILAAKPEQELQLEDQEKRILKFPLRAERHFLGLSDLRVQVQGQGGEGPINLDRSFAVEVKPLTPEKQVRRFREIAPNSRINLREEELGGLLPQTVLAHLNLSDQPPLDVKSAIRGLLQYPYGCVEQTTSTTYPHLFIDADQARELGLKSFDPDKRSQIVARSMSKLAAAQGTEGGFNLWGGGEPEAWLSAYVANFLQDARDQGFEVPAGMQDKVMAYLLKNLQKKVGRVSGKSCQSLSQKDDSAVRESCESFQSLAYGAYVLARESKAPLSTLRQLFQVRESATSGLSLVHLGLALHLMGDREKGMQAIEEGVAKPSLAGWWHDYGSRLRDAALVYALLGKHGLDAPERGNLLMTAAGELKGRTWFSTQEQMALFLAGNFLRGQRDGTAWQAVVESGTSSRQLEDRGELGLSLSVRDLREGLTVSNRSRRTLYATLTMNGRLKTIPPAAQNGIALARRVYNADGTPFQSDRMRSGESYFVHVRVSSTSPQHNVMVVDHIPAGLEIENFNLTQGPGVAELSLDNTDVAESMSSSQILHQEFREDRFVAALDLSESHYDSKTSTSVFAQDLFYKVRAVTPGTYTWPSLSAEDMYQPGINGFAPGGGTIKVEEGRR